MCETRARRVGESVSVRASSFASEARQGKGKDVTVAASESQPFCLPSKNRDGRVNLPSNATGSRGIVPEDPLPKLCLSLSCTCENWSFTCFFPSCSGGTAERHSAGYKLLVVAAQLLFKFRHAVCSVLAPLVTLGPTTGIHKTSVHDLTAGMSWPGYTGNSSRHETWLACTSRPKADMVR